jgi:uncharacterized membrane protein (DUF485 family)
MNDDLNTALNRVTVWAEYRKRRRYFSWWMAAFMLLVVPGFVIARLLPPDNDVRHVLIVVLISCGLLAGVVSFIIWLWVMSWPCPRCNKSFAYTPFNSAPTDECKHCGCRVEDHITARNDGVGRPVA